MTFDFEVMSIYTFKDSKISIMNLCNGYTQMYLDFF